MSSACKAIILATATRPLQTAQEAAVENVVAAILQLQQMQNATETFVTGALASEPEQTLQTEPKALWTALEALRAGYDHSRDDVVRHVTQGLNDNHANAEPLQDWKAFLCDDISPGNIEKYVKGARMAGKQYLLPRRNL